MLQARFRLVIAGEAPWPLFAFGPAGTGKTCACLCILDHVEGEYFTANGLCETLIQSQQGRLENSHEGRAWLEYPEKFWRRIHGAALVVLDELGCRDRVTDHHYETVKRCIDERQGQPLICTSNLGLERIAQVYDDRIASRLAAGTVIELHGKDQRL